MHTIRYIMVGGFLGAGKTTTLGRLARHFTDQGQNVGVVTNDQATDLVDTNTFRSQGFDCLLYTSPSPRDKRQSRMPSSA